jgi:hypothetical protein
MKEQFVDFMESPSRDTYLAVRGTLLASPDYKPYSDELNGIDGLLEIGSFAAVQETIARSMPNLLLSPRAHLFLSLAAEKSNDENAAGMERFIAAACVEGILATGDGSRDRPYLVCRSTDEYDVLQYLGKEFRGQALVHDGDRHFDLMECEGGTEIWFDITAAYNKLEERFDRAAPRPDP